MDACDFPVGMGGVGTGGVSGLSLTWIKARPHLAASSALFVAAADLARIIVYKTAPASSH